MCDFVIIIYIVILRNDIYDNRMFTSIIAFSADNNKIFPSNAKAQDTWLRSIMFQCQSLNLLKEQQCDEQAYFRFFVITPIHNIIFDLLQMKGEG